ncbi:hypothetical protein [uncultured Flavobacterium sp.]|uniref:hypothetical protein n=1 Tax=uncultured Flavobacterium sp. TaxID=165435 RepID=UPI002599844E|nr:hypothetical protein [uncultured Flavobacterium sp.]
MKKQLNGCLVFLGIFIILIGAIISWFYYGMVTSNERQHEDNKNCKSIEFITDNPLIIINDDKDVFNTDIKLYLINKNDTIEKKVLKNNSHKRIEFKIPFNNFNKTNEILILIKNRNYKVSEMGYNNEGRWGMFGYLGGKCEFSYNCELINE